KEQSPCIVLDAGALWCKSLTMTYFHRRMPTIIGAKAFHVPVRDGKAWDHLAMVVKRKGLLGQAWEPALANLKKKHDAAGAILPMSQRWRGWRIAATFG